MVDSSMINIVILTVIFVAVTYVFGLIYAAISGAIKQCMIKSVGWTGFCIFSVIGVPFHELSHFITAILFNHTITDMSLFRPIKGKKDGVLGYVNHAYSKYSLYQLVGNFFIGMAPMLSGAAVMAILLHLAIPQTIDVLLSATNVTDTMLVIVKDVWTALREGNVYIWVMMIAAVLICPHMSMSGADFKNTVQGLLFLLIASVVVPCLIFHRAGISYDFQGYIIFFACLIYVYVMLIGMVISLFVLLINAIISLFII